jgi:hypothetical protein
MGILDTTNVSWFTGKVPKSKEILILRYFESKNINYTRSDDFSNKKRQKSNFSRKMPFFC